MPTAYQQPMLDKCNCFALKKAARQIARLYPGGGVIRRPVPVRLGGAGTSEKGYLRSSRRRLQPSQKRSSATNVEIFASRIRAMDLVTTQRICDVLLVPIAQAPCDVSAGDNLTNSEVSAQVIRSVLDLLLLHSSEVTIVEP